MLWAALLRYTWAGLMATCAGRPRRVALGTPWALVAGATGCATVGRGLAAWAAGLVAAGLVAAGLVAAGLVAAGLVA
ncbi:MAG: hypothetical protein E6R03_13295, partial [Hyphomicrobiaceae bacterium]